MSVFVGIDPGVNGAIGFVGDMDEAWVHDMPTIETKVSGAKKKRHVIDARAIREMLSYKDDVIQLVVIEKVAPVVIVGGKSMMGGPQSFQLGKAAGLVEGVIAGMRLPYQLVTPQGWKKEMLGGTSKDKGAAIIRARQMFPKVDLSRKKDDGRAEALLIARYAKLVHSSLKGV